MMNADITPNTMFSMEAVLKYPLGGVMYFIQIYKRKVTLFYCEFTRSYAILIYMYSFFG
jgi:hypothetical protein